MALVKCDCSTQQSCEYKVKSVSKIYFWQLGNIYKTKYNKLTLAK